MATAKTQLIIKHLDGFGGSFLDSQYLGQVAEIGGPTLLNDTMMKIFSAQTIFYSGKPLMGMTGAKAGGMREIDRETFRWYLHGAEEKRARVIENLEAGNTAPGLNHQIIRVKLDLDYFHEPDVLFPEDNRYPLEIVGKPQADGAGFIYQFRLQGDDPAIFLPPELLEVGKEFNKVWTTVSSEFNGIFGTQEVPSSFQLESQVGAFAQEFTVTDKAWREQGMLQIGIPYKKGNKTTIVKSFLPMAEAIMHNTLYESMEAQMIYGVKETREGVDGYWKKTGQSATLGSNIQMSTSLIAGTPKCLAA